MLIWLTRSVFFKDHLFTTVTKALGAELGASAECQAVQDDYLDCNKEMLCLGFCCITFVKSSSIFKRDGRHYSASFT